MNENNNSIDIEVEKERLRQICEQEPFKSEGRKVYDVPENKYGIFALVSKQPVSLETQRKILDSPWMADIQARLAEDRRTPAFESSCGAYINYPSKN